MKKVLLGAGMLVMLVCGGFESKAIGIKIGGVEISIQRGHKEWNNDHTATLCVGRGLCDLVIKADVNVGIIKGNLGTDGSGKLILVLSKETEAAYAADFTGSSYASEDVFLPGELTRGYGYANGFQIRKGEHTVLRDTGSGRLYINL